MNTIILNLNTQHDQQKNLPIEFTLYQNASKQHAATPKG